MGKINRSVIAATTLFGMSHLEQIAEGQTFPSEGLVRYYNFDEGSSIFAGDATGNHGLIVADSWTPNGKINAAYNPNGNSYNSAFRPIGSDVLSINFWMKKTADWGFYQDIVGTGSSGGSFYLDTAGNQALVAYFGGGSGNTSFPSDGNYHMTTLTISDGNQRGYIDGSLEFSLSLPFSFSGNNVRLFGGTGGSLPNNIFNVDELGIWNRTLNSEEINALYNQGHALPFPAPSAVGLGLVASGLALKRRRSKI